MNYATLVSGVQDAYQAQHHLLVPTAPVKPAVASAFKRNLMRLLARLQK